MGLRDEVWFEALRRREFARLDDTRQAYLDYTGSALYGESQVRAQAALLARGVFGNPHSEHAPSRASVECVEEARRAVLALFDVDERTHAVCFTANASAAFKLVAEGYPFDSARGLVLSADNHNSVNGIREYARRAGAPVDVLPLDAQLRLDDAGARLAQAARRGPGLFAFPAQSNFSGVKHPLDLVDAAHALGLDVLLDAAAFVGTNPLSLRRCRADYVAVSFYKMIGLPTGLGALVARREALARLQRPWFSGGTVDFVSVQHARHRLRAGHEGYEDGTPNFLGCASLASGLALMAEVGLERLSARVNALALHFIDRARGLRHANGARLVRAYGATDAHDRGGTVAFNVLAYDGTVVPYLEVERRASAAGVSIRGGCFCNPGAAEAAFGFEPAATARCFDALGADFSIPRFSACLGPGTAVGAVRASFGMPTVARDIERLVSVLEEFREPRVVPASDRRRLQLVS